MSFNRLHYNTAILTTIVLTQLFVYQQQSGNAYTIEMHLKYIWQLCASAQNIQAALYELGWDQYAATNANPNIAWGTLLFLWPLNEKAQLQYAAGIYWSTLFDEGGEPGAISSLT